MKTIPLHSHVLALFALIVLSSPGEEVLLHTGPTVSTPISSSASLDNTTEELTFVKQFHIDSDALSKLPAAGLTNASAPVSAARAIELASRSVIVGEPRSFNVRRLELLVSSTTLPKRIDYYLIEMEMNGTAEHRIILMDGSVIKPRLKKAGKSQ